MSENYICSYPECGRPLHNVPKEIEAFRAKVIEHFRKVTDEESLSTNDGFFSLDYIEEVINSLPIGDEK